MAFVEIQPLRIVVAIALLLLYGYYVYEHARSEEKTHVIEEEIEEGTPVETDAEELGPLRFAPKAKDPSMNLVVIQLVVSLGVMVVGATMFVEQVTVVANVLGIPALILSLLIAPIATELPEKFNSVLWVRRGKDTLALGNISGAMVFQSCFPVSFGLVFTTWSARDNPAAFVSAALALVAGAFLWLMMRSGQRKLTAYALMFCGVFYIGYVLYLLVGVLPYGTGAAH
jgi:cation:H+ antiporter